MDFVQKQFERFRTSAAEEKLCYILLFSIFLPFMLTAIVVLTVLCLLLSKKEARDRIFQADGIKWFGVLCIPLFLSPILQMHWLGLAAGVGQMCIRDSPLVGYQTSGRFFQLLRGIL